MQREPIAATETSLSATECLERLALARQAPPELLRAAMAGLDEIAPALLALTERAADGEALSDDEATLMFRGLHLLGTARDTRAFQPLLRLLRREISDLEELLGDATTESLPRIVAGVFDGDAEALFAAVIDGRIYELIRCPLLKTAAFLCWDGRIDRGRMIAFLERFHDQPLVKSYDAAWDGWQDAIALLGLRTLVPRVERAWRRDHVPEILTDKEFFAEMLARAEVSPRDGTRFDEEGLGYFEDIVEALSWTASEEDFDAYPDAEDDALDDKTPLDIDAEEEATNARTGDTHVPATNPLRNVGRNDPCPCGSGKKAKRCCLAR